MHESCRYLLVLKAVTVMFLLVIMGHQNTLKKPLVKKLVRQPHRKIQLGRTSFFNNAHDDQNTENLM